MTPEPNVPLDEESLAGADPAAIHSALFGQLVAGHGQMALMFLGCIENPHTGLKEAPQPEAAKIFIDQLEMIAAKTRGNLDAGEIQLLERTIAVVHHEFVALIDRLNDPDGPRDPG
ncbi:MAG: DUF1844 domain-containing protein [Verrucomicrobia bacterium]|nr:MAG: DUF1844 domain-containing protein [Verrucomicrobiota bacterium]